MFLVAAARVVKKDPSHPRAVVLRFSEDGNLFWLPVEQVSKWLQVRCCSPVLSNLSHPLATLPEVNSIHDGSNVAIITW